MLPDPKEVETETDSEAGAIADARAAYDEIAKASAEKAPAASTDAPAEEAAALKEGKAAEPEKPKDAKPDGRARGADGKFVKADTASADAAPAAPAAPDAAAQPPGEAAAQDVAAPEQWSQLEKDRFAAFVAKAGPEAGKILLEARQSLEKGYQEKFTKAAQFQQEAQTFDQIFAPLQQEMAGHGVTRPQVVARLVGAHLALSGPNRAQALQQIAKDYGIDLPTAAAPAGAYPANQAPGGPPNGSEAPMWLDPMAERETAALKAQLQALTGTIGQLTKTQADAIAARQKEAETQTYARIATFRDAKATDGTPAHPYFSEVYRHMGHLMDMTDAQGARIYPDMESAYAAACKLHPEISSVMERKAQEAAAKKLADERRKDVERAKAAAQPAPAPAQVSTPRDKPVVKRDNAVNDARAAYQELVQARV